MRPNEATAPARFGACDRRDSKRQVAIAFDRRAFRAAHAASVRAKEFNLTEAVFGRECLHVATTEGKRIQATQMSRRWVRRGRKSG